MCANSTMNLTQAQEACSVLSCDTAGCIWEVCATNSTDAVENHEIRGVFFAQFSAEEFEAIGHHVRGMSKQAR